MLTLFLLPLMLWTSRNYLVFKKPVFLASKGGLFFYSSWTPPQGKIYGVATHDNVTKEADLITSERERDIFLYKKGLEVIKSGPKRALKLLVLKNLYFWSVFDWETLGYGIYNFSTAFIIPFFLAGLFMLKRQHYLPVSAFIILIAYYLLLANVFMGLPRYRIQVEPYMIILGSYAIVLFYETAKSKIYFVAGLTSWLFLNLVLFAFSGTSKVLIRGFCAKIGVW